MTDTPMLSIVVPNGLSPEEQATWIKSEMQRIGLDPDKIHDAFILADRWATDDNVRCSRRVRLDGTPKEKDE